MKHKHTSNRSKSIDRCYLHPVAKHSNPKAHGNICRTERCDCGAVRLVNINGMHTETGPWTNK